MFILPLYCDEDDPPTLPAAVTCLLLTNVFVWLATCIWASAGSLFANYGFTPAHASFSSALASMFLHTGFWHVAGNMWFLWMLGRRVENTLGTGLFTFIYIGSGFGAAGIHLLSDTQSLVPCVGASGAISGILGCFWVLFPRASFDLEIYIGWWRVKHIRSQTTGAAGAWFVEQTLLGLLSRAVHFTSVAFWAHVGGFVAGVFAAILLRKVGLVDGELYAGRVMSRADIARLDRY